MVADTYITIQVDPLAENSGVTTSTGEHGQEVFTLSLDSEDIEGELCGSTEVFHCFFSTMMFEHLLFRLWTQELILDQDYSDSDNFIDFLNDLLGPEFERNSILGMYAYQNIDVSSFPQDG